MHVPAVPGELTWRGTLTCCVKRLAIRLSEWNKQPDTCDVRIYSFQALCSILFLEISTLTNPPNIRKNCLASTTPTMATTASNLPKGSLILVTGVNGFVASHVVDRLLEDGFNVRGSVRSEEKGKWLHQVFGSRYGKGRFETVIVPDMQADGAFDAAVKGVTGICHTASIMTFVDKPEEVIPTVVSHAHDTSMKKVALTS